MSKSVNDCLLLVNNGHLQASYMVFEKLKLEGFAGHDDVRLKTSLRIPKVVVGRIIGKAGKNVRELQRVTGAMVKLPEDPTTQGDEVTVEVYGNFLSIQVSFAGVVFTACLYKLGNTQQLASYCSGVLQYWFNSG